MPLNANSMLAANQPQTPNGTSLSASAMLGLPGMGDDLKDQTADELKKRKQDPAGNVNAYGVDFVNNAVASIFGTTK
jgi:hypothetical protein